MMELTTKVEIDKAGFCIEPCEEMLFAGSCFADNIGRRCLQDRFRATVNPFGVMYNPASIMHTVEKTTCAPLTAVLTLGTNHVYVLNETGQIVDNCMKKPQRLFTERELTVEECEDYLIRSISLLQARRAGMRVILTVSPIRYAKYGYHGSRLSKAVLLLAADRVARRLPDMVSYFPAYEIMNDELRGYRFYAADMLHPSEQAVDYIWQRFGDTYFSGRTQHFLEEWRPVKDAIRHRPFNPESEEYLAFMRRTLAKADALAASYSGFSVPTELERFRE